MQISPGRPPRRLRVTDLPELALVTLDLAEPDVLIVTAQGLGERFQVLYIPEWSNAALAGLLVKARQDRSPRPLVILPFLNEEKLNTLAAAGVSGLDLCGNAILLAPGRWLLRYTGQPNRFKPEIKPVNPFGGRASLVGRALLLRPAFPSLNALHASIARGGGAVSLALASRAVRALKADLIVEHDPQAGIRLAGATRLLDQLASAWSKARPLTLWRGRASGDLQAVLAGAFERAAAGGARALMTGVGSSARYANLNMEAAYLYVDNPDAVLAGLGAEENARFPNLELLAPPDDSVYFDARPDALGIRWASPVQAFMEMHNADPRLRQAADELREDILRRIAAPDARGSA